MRLRWPAPLLQTLRPRWRAFGRPALAGLLMLAASGLLALVATPAWRAQAQALDLQWQRERQAAAQRAHQSAADTVWPAATARDARIATLVETALRHGLSPGSIEQQTRQDGGGRVAWLMVSMPLRGTYADLRAFIAAALQADPALALESLRLRRAGAEAGPLDADLTWAFAQAADEGPRP